MFTIMIITCKICNKPFSDKGISTHIMRMHGTLEDKARFKQSGRGKRKEGFAAKMRMIVMQYRGITDEVRVCTYCSTKFFVTSTSVQQFCSRSCCAKQHNVNRIVTRFCLHCGAGHKNKFYCSSKCSAVHQAGQIPEGERIERARLNNLLGVRRYQARRYQQTPIDADQVKIRTFYANCPEGHEVDHIIPISKGGLHHQNNLQYLPKSENRRKSNKLDYTPLAEWVGI